MHNTIKFAISYIRYYKKQALILFFGICMSVLLLTGISSLIYSNHAADYTNAKKEYGNWNYTIPVSEKLMKEKNIKYSGDNFDLKQIGLYCAKQYENDNQNITFCYGDNSYLKMTGRTVLEGKYPEKTNEIALDYYALHNLDMNYTLGNTLKLGNKKYILTGIISEGAKADDNSIMVFSTKNAILNMDGDSVFYLKFSDKKRAYEQFSAFLQANQIHLTDWEMNDGIAIYTGAEPKENFLNIILTASQLKKGKLIYLLGTLDNNSNILQKMVFAVIFIFGIFIIHSILQVTVEKRIGQYGILEVLGIEEKNIFTLILSELLLLFFPAYFIGSFFGITIAKILYKGEFKVDNHSLCLGFILFFIFLLLCCMVTVRNMRKSTQAEKIRNYSGRRNRKIICLKRHNLMGVLSKRFILAKSSTFAGIIISLSLGGVLFICTTYVADNAKQNNMHAMQTDEGLYTDITVSIEDDDLGKTIPKDIVNTIEKTNIKGIKDLFPVSYTLGEVPLKNGIFQWTEFYPELSKDSDTAPDKDIMEKYNGIITRQSKLDYKLKVNVYGYEKQQLSDLSEYLLEGDIQPDSMVQHNQVILKTLMDGAGYYDGIDIHPGDYITLKVPKNTANNNTELLKFQSDDSNYTEKDFVVSAIVSRCTGETDEFIGAGSDTVSIIMPQQMMEENFNITDYNNLNINLQESADSNDVIKELKPLFSGLNRCVMHDNTINIDKKNAVLMQKAYFFYGIAIILFFISLLHTMNTMKHQIQSRRYELGILRAMGITEPGFRNMLMKEGFFYGMATSISMLVLTVICQKVLAGIMQHVVRYIIVNNNVPILPFLIMVFINITVCVLVMLLSGRELLHENIVDEIKQST